MNNKIDGLGQAGAIFNVFVGIMWCCTVIGLAWGLPTIFANLRYMRNGDNRTRAGILGLFFGSIIGGVFVLVSKNSVEIDRNNFNNTPPSI